MTSLQGTTKLDIAGLNPPFPFFSLDMIDGIFLRDVRRRTFSIDSHVEILSQTDREAGGVDQLKKEPGEEGAK